MSGYCTLPRPKGWPCACPVNVRSYFDKSALECPCCGLRITGEERVRMLFERNSTKEKIMVSPVFNSDPQASMLNQQSPQQQTGFNNVGGAPYQPQHEGKRDQQFDSEAHRRFMRSLG